MSAEPSKPTCFIAMPITTHEHEKERYGGDDDHWTHVMETLFVPAILAAGFEPIRPVAVGSALIHAQIIKHLSTADMVLCDLSSQNPNVFFELGVRTSLNLPIALVKDELTKIPFDTNGLNTEQYASTLRGWETADQVKALTTHLVACIESSDGHNPMWEHYGLRIAAEKPDADAGSSSTDAQVQLIYEALNQLQMQVSRSNRASSEPFHEGTVNFDRNSDRLIALGRDVGRLIDAEFNGWVPEGRRGYRIQFTRRGEVHPGTRDVSKEYTHISRLATNYGFSLNAIYDGEAPHMGLLVEDSSPWPDGLVPSL